MLVPNTTDWVYKVNCVNAKITLPTSSLTKYYNPPRKLQFSNKKTPKSKCFMPQAYPFSSLVMAITCPSSLSKMPNLIDFEQLIFLNYHLNTKNFIVFF